MTAIDAEHLKKWILARWLDNGGKDNDAPTAEEILDQIDREIRFASVILAVPRWIPCSEQLPPEENKSYWVCLDTGHQRECRWTNTNPVWTQLTTNWHWSRFDIPQYTNVVAWMELPDPY